MKNTQAGSWGLLFLENPNRNMIAELVTLLAHRMCGWCGKLILLSNHLFFPACCAVWDRLRSVAVLAAACASPHIWFGVFAHLCELWRLQNIKFSSSVPFHSICPLCILVPLKSGHISLYSDSEFSVHSLHPMKQQCAQIWFDKILKYFSEIFVF